jgi:hypothetical protein
MENGEYNENIDELILECKNKYYHPSQNSVENNTFEVRSRYLIKKIFGHIDIFFDIKSLYNHVGSTLMLDFNVQYEPINHLPIQNIPHVRDIKGCENIISKPANLYNNIPYASMIIKGTNSKKVVFQTDYLDIIHYPFNTYCKFLHDNVDSPQIHQFKYWFDKDSTSDLVHFITNIDENIMKKYLDKSVTSIVQKHKVKHCKSIMGKKYAENMDIYGKKYNKISNLRYIVFKWNIVDDKFCSHIYVDGNKIDIETNNLSKLDSYIKIGSNVKFYITFEKIIICGSVKTLYKRFTILRVDVDNSALNEDKKIIIIPSNDTHIVNDGDDDNEDSGDSGDSSDSSDSGDVESNGDDNW